MDVAFCRTTGDEFRAALREFDDDPAVGGALVLATPGGAFTPAAVDETLRVLSTRVFGGLFPKAIYEGGVANDGRGHLEDYNKTAVVGAVDGL